MKFSVRVVLHADDGTETMVHEVFHLNRGALTPDSLGLGLGEGVQRVLELNPAVDGCFSWSES